MTGLILTASANAAPAVAPAKAAGELKMPPFGSVTIVRPAGKVAENPRHVVLWIADGATTEDLPAFAEASGSIVARVDLGEYVRHLTGSKSKCAYPAAHFEALSQGLQKELGLARYVYPELLGTGAGATLAYAVLAESPPATFRGAISVGYSPRLDLPFALCRQNHLDYTVEDGPGKGTLKAAATLPGAWVVLPRHAEEGAAAAPFAKGVATAAILDAQPASQASLLRALARLDELAEPAQSAPGDAQVADLPLIELPSSAIGRDELAVIYSGDGGWAGLDRDVGGALLQAGIPVIGVSSLQYFWTRRTPDGAAADLVRVLRHYLSAWKRQRIVLIGYSAGADVLPFLAARLPADLRSRVAAVVMLGPSDSASFEFHVAEWLGHDDDSSLPTAPEVAKIGGPRGLKVLCFYGADESDSLCPALPKGLVTLYPEAGSHHFGGHYDVLAETILREIEPRP
ncbi:MAG: AcvB/VirJ family lysyl-phosphatidylglycerol hydrolase [Acidobacteriota bacterium]